MKLAEMSVQHSKDCAAFITLASKALPRYRAIMGPFQWPVWVAIIATYLLAIFPLAFSDRLTLSHLIGNWSEMENMFWYVFGTFTNSLTFSGTFSWSYTKKNSTRLLIGFYWMFTIIITACYTSSIIAFVTLPVFPDTVDAISELLSGFYRVGTFGELLTDRSPKICLLLHGSNITIWRKIFCGESTFHLKKDSFDEFLQ